MSKSLGNFFTVRDLLEGRGPGEIGVPGEVIRFVMLSTHYRKPMDWTEKKRAEAEAKLRKWLNWLKSTFIHFSPENLKLYADEEKYSPDALVVEALKDDLNVHAAFSRLDEMFGNDEFENVCAFVGSLFLLGILSEETEILCSSWLAAFPAKGQKWLSLSPCHAIRPSQHPMPSKDRFQFLH